MWLQIKKNRKPPGRPADWMSPKQTAFVREYLIDCNATQAAIRAGYSAKTAAAIGAENLTKPHIAAALQTSLAAREQKSEVKADAILAEVDNLATSDIGDLIDFSGPEPMFRPGAEITPEARRCIASVKVTKRTEKGKGDNKDKVEIQVTEFKLWDKVAALRLALQHRGLLKSGEQTFNLVMPVSFIEVATSAPLTLDAAPAIASEQAGSAAADRGSEPPERYAGDSI